MDPSIMQLLEQDEDETMHSGADVDAFTAALNRDIEGDTSTSQPSDSDLSVLSQGNNYASNQFLHQWNPSTHMENASCTSQQDTMVIQQQMQTEAKPSESDLQQQESQKPPNESSSQELQQQPFAPEQKSFLEDSRQQNASHLSQQAANMNAQVHNPVADRMHNADYESQLMKLQNMNSQPAAVSRMGNQQSLATAAGVSNKQSVLPGANSQQTMTSTGNNNQLASGPSLRGKQVPFGMLLPVIQPQLDKDRAMQLNNIYNRLRKNEIPKEDFVRHMKSIVGDQMLKMAVYKLQSQAARHAQNMPQLAAHAQAPAPAPAPAPAQQWQLPTASDGNTNASKARDIERVPGLQTPMAAYGSSASNYQPFSGQNANVSASALKLGPHDPQTRHIPAYQNMSTSPLGMTAQGMNVSNMSKFDRPNSFGDPKRLQVSNPAHMTNPSVLQQNSVWQPSSSSNEQKSGTSSSMSYVKQEPFDQPNELHRPQISAPYGSGVLTPPSSVHAAQGNLISGNLKDESVDMQYSRAGFSTNALTSNLKTSIASQTDTFNSLNSRATPATPPVTLGNNAKTSSKKSTGQKKPLEVPGSSPPPSSKKQKVSGAFLDQSIEQLNDVTAVSGVDLREEEEQLFSGPKEDSRVTEASRRVVQEEEERLIIEKVPFQRKLAEIMAKSGLKGISNDVERCLSLCVEERIRGLIGNLIRVSKQRLDIEKPRHKTIVTSDVGQQIMSMNKKARAEWEKKQAEADKLLKLNELPEGNLGADGEKDKDESRSRMAKVVNKEEDDKMRTTAANVAARAAVGGDDMLSKWQLMAEQARQKREGDGGTSTSSHPPERDIERKQSSSSVSLKDNQQVDKKGQSTTTASSTPAGAAVASKKVGKSRAVLVSYPKVARSSISVKDVVAVLEREPQMSRSTLIYRLYEKIRSEAAAAAAAE